MIAARKDGQVAIRETEGLGTLVKRYRTVLGLTQEELAERAGVSARSISDLERGLERTPHLSTIRRLADALELSPAQRAVFMAAGSKARGGEDLPEVMQSQPHRLPAVRLPALRLPQWRIAAAVLLALVLVAATATALISRAGTSSPTQPAVYSTARAPAVIGSWGTVSGKVRSFGPVIPNIVVGPPGYDYAVSGGATDIALRFSPNGQTLAAFPVTNAASGFRGAGVDRQGNLWVNTNIDIRKYAPDGHLVARWARTGVNPGQFDGPSAIGFAGNGDVAIGELGSHRVQVLTPDLKPIRQWLGPGADPQNFRPWAFAIDAQNDVYVLDGGNWQIEKYSLEGKLLGILQLQGLERPVQGASSGFDLSVDRGGNVYVMTSTPSSIVVEKLSPGGRQLARWTSIGPHPRVSGNAYGLELTRRGYGYLGTNDGRILKIDGNMRVLADWSTRRLRQSIFRSPVSVAADGAGHAYVADAAARQVIELSTRTGTITRWTAPVDPMVSGPFGSSLAVDPEGNVILAEANGSRLDTYSQSGQLIHRSGKPISSTGPALAYAGLGIDSGGKLSALTYPQPNVRTYSPAGRLIHSWCAVCDLPLPNSPATMAVSPAGNVYVAVPSEIVEFTPEGIPLHSWSAKTISRGDPLLDIAGMAADRRGNLYVTDLDQNALEIFSPSGRFLASWKGPGDKTAFTSLGPVTVDRQGNIFLVNGKSVLEFAPLKAAGAR